MIMTKSENATAYFPDTLNRSKAVLARLFYFNQFHIKHQRGIRRDNAHIPVAVTNGRRNNQGGFSPLFHQCDSLIPTLDYLAPAKHEFYWILAFS